MCLFCQGIQAQNWKWGKAAHGAIGNPRVALDPWGNAFSAGNTSYFISTSPVSFGPYTLGSIGYQAIVIGKYDPHGNLLWARGTENGDANLAGVTADAFGNVYVFGEYDSHYLKIGPFVLDNTNSTEQHFIAKYDAAGNVIWAKNILHHWSASFPWPTWTPNVNNSAVGIASDKSGNVYITGFFEGPIAKIGPFTLTNLSGTMNTVDAYLAKIDSAGNILWAKSFGGDQSDCPSAIVVTPSNNVYVHGAFSSLDFTIGSTVLPNPTGSAAFVNWEIFLAKFDSMGNPIWARGSLGTFVSSEGLAVDSAENPFIVGLYQFDDYVTFGHDTLRNPVYDQYSSYFVKYDSSGNVVWGKTITADAPTPRTVGVWATSVATDPCGNVRIAGYVYDTASVDGNTVTVPVGASGWPLFISEFTNGGAYLNSQVLLSGGFHPQMACDGMANLYLCSDYIQNTRMVFGGDTLFEPTIFQSLFLAKYGYPEDTLKIHSDTTMCAAKITLQLYAPDGYADYKWSNGSTASSIKIDTSGIYVVNGTGSCPSHFLADTFHVTLISHGDTSYQRMDTVICVNGSLELKAPPGYTSYLWENGSTNSSIVANSSGVYKVNAYRMCDMQTKTFDITERNFTFSVNSVSPVCTGIPAQVSAVVTAPDVPQIVQWTPAAGLSDTNSLNTTFRAYNSGIYKYYLTIQNTLGCVATDSVSVTVKSIQVSADPVEAAITYGGQVRLNASLPGEAANSLIYAWSPDDGSLDNPNINNPIAAPLKTTTYTVIAMNPEGCRDTATQTVTVGYSEGGIPDAFSPNGDGLNDVFRVRNSYGQKLVEFSIFNRWGELIYHSNDPSKGWDGTYKGARQETGVYHYMILAGMPDGSNKVYKGDVTLIR